MARNRYWFAPKRFGIGSGLPISWEGWVLLGGFVVLLAFDMAAFWWSPWRFAGAAALVAAFGFVCWRKTEGGWRWRS